MKNLTTAGSPYDLALENAHLGAVRSYARTGRVTPLERAPEEVFGADAIHAQLLDVSVFTDVTLNSLAEQSNGEVMRRKASPLFEGIGQAIAIHLLELRRNGQKVA